MQSQRLDPITHAALSASESSRPPTHAAKRAKLTVMPLSKVYIVQAKLESPVIAELFLLAEKNCEKLCSEVEEADVIVTVIGTRKRLERHVSWEVAKTKAVVTPDWLRDSVKGGRALPCEPYIAMEDLHQETLQHCPDCNMGPCGCDDSDDVLDKETPPGTPAESTLHGEAAGSAVRLGAPRSQSELGVLSYLLAPDPPLPTNISNLTYKSRYACQRPSPLVCPNQKLVVELDVIRRSRALEGEERSALSYARAIGVIKAYPHIITSRSQAAKLPHIGTKIIGLVEEFLDTGRISEVRRIATSSRFQALSIFSSVYGIGPHTARKLHALGLQTLEELEVYYGVDRNEVLHEGRPRSVSIAGADQAFAAGPEEMERPHEEWWPGKGRDTDAKGKKLSSGGTMIGDNDSELGESWIRVALGLREDLAVKIPKNEVEEMGRVVMLELAVLEAGCTSTIVGGYRRGKPESNDVDIVFTHPDPAKINGLCKRLVQRLHERGMVTHVMHLSNFHGHNPLCTTHWDSLEKALTVFILPPSSPFYKEKNGHGIRRRLDLIFARPEVYWSAVIGWSGSIMFQRDLRQWAKDKCGMKFDSSGITRRYDSKPFYPKTEKQVFDLFGLEWVDPTWRNADV